MSPWSGGVGGRGNRYAGFSRRRANVPDSDPVRARGRAIAGIVYMQTINPSTMHPFAAQQSYRAFSKGTRVPAIHEYLRRGDGEYTGASAKQEEALEMSTALEDT